MRVFSACDGMSCGLTALKRAGIPVSTYFASEVDKWAIKVAHKNHPDIVQLGDLMSVDVGSLGGIDLFLAGPPCQGFSGAGKRLNWGDPRSGIFIKTIELLRDLKPKYFLIENVASMGSLTRASIDFMLGVDSFSLNSNLVSAQNRDRFYWTNLPAPGPPKDQGLTLRDILEENVEDKYYLREGSVTGQRSLKHLNDSLRTLDEKARTLTASSARNPSGSSSTCLILQRPRGENNGGLKALSGKTPALGAHSWVDNNHLILGGRVRRLTPVECERLQTLPDNYTEGVSNTQRYKMIGNGWTIDAIVHILRGIPSAPRAPAWRPPFSQGPI